jgi:hypothetical protein
MPAACLPYSPNTPIVQLCSYPAVPIYETLFNCPAVPDSLHPSPTSCPPPPPLPPFFTHTTPPLVSLLHPVSNSSDHHHPGNHIHTSTYFYLFAPCNIAPFPASLAPHITCAPCPSLFTLDSPCFSTTFIPPYPAPLHPPPPSLT